MKQHEPFTKGRPQGLCEDYQNMKKPSLVRFPWTLRVARNRVLGAPRPYVSSHLPANASNRQATTRKDH